MSPGLNSLNREGRPRLNEAFVKVNVYFQALFTTLFGGGTAVLITAETFLDAG